MVFQRKQPKNNHKWCRQKFVDNDRRKMGTKEYEHRSLKKGRWKLTGGGHKKSFFRSWSTMVERNCWWLAECRPRLWINSRQKLTIRVDKELYPKRQWTEVCRWRWTVVIVVLRWLPKNDQSKFGRWQLSERSRQIFARSGGENVKRKLSIHNCVKNDAQRFTDDSCYI